MLQSVSFGALRRLPVAGRASLTAKRNNIALPATGAGPQPSLSPAAPRPPSILERNPVNAIRATCGNVADDYRKPLKNGVTSATAAVMAVKAAAATAVATVKAAATAAVTIAQVREKCSDASMPTP